MFFVPITINGKNTIPVDHVVSLVRLIPNYAPVYAGIIVTVGALIPFVKGKWNEDISSIIFYFCVY